MQDKKTLGSASGNEWASQDWKVENVPVPPQDKPTTKIMVVSTDGTSGRYVRHELQTVCPNWDIHAVAGREESLELISQQPFACVLLAAGPGQTIELDMVLELQVHSARGTCPIVLVSDSVTPELIAESGRAGVSSVIPWESINASYLELAVTSALGQWRLMRAIDLLNQQIEEKQQRRNAQRVRAEHFAHELLTPLASVQEYISLVFDGVSGPINATQSSHLAYARGGCATIEASIEALVVAAGNQDIYPIQGTSHDDEQLDTPTIASSVQAVR